MNADQLNFFEEIFNEVEVLLTLQLSVEPSVEEIIVAEHKRRKRKGKFN